MDSSFKGNRWLICILPLPFEKGKGGKGFSDVRPSSPGEREIRLNLIQTLQNVSELSMRSLALPN